MCYPQFIPGHITALYVFTVVNLAVLLNFALVDADVVILNHHNRTVDNGIADEPARFGPAIPDGGVWGHLVYSNPNNGCGRIDKPPKFPDNATAGIGNKWIALMKRGGCNFDEKVLNAQKAGYVAAIVCNVNGSNQLIPMGGSKVAQNVTIPSVFIGDKDGRILRDNFDRLPNYNIVLDMSWEPPGSYELAVVIFVVFGTIIGVSFLTLIVIGIVKWVRDIRRRQRARLSKQHLKKIPIHKFRKGDPYDVCAICLDEYEEGDKLRVLPCNHAYHQKCIDPWLTKNKKTCPICKQKVIPGRERNSDSESESETDESENEANSENSPLLRGNRDNNNGSRSRGNTFDNSGVPELFRPRVPHSSDDSSGEETSRLEPMHSVYQSSVEVHSEPDNRTRVRPPKRRGGLNTRYNLVSEDGAERSTERPRTAPPQIRPRPNRAWEFGISPASSPGDRNARVGATGGQTDVMAVDIDVDDVAPSRPIAFANPATLHPMDDHIENHMDTAEANQQAGTSSSGSRDNGARSQGPSFPGARPRRKNRDSDGLLLVHKTDQHRKGSARASGAHGIKRKSRGTHHSADVSRADNDLNASSRKHEKNSVNETVRSQEVQPQTESETGKSQASESAENEAQGAVGGVAEPSPPTTDSKDSDEVEIRSARHKKKSKKKRKRDDEA